MSILSKWYLKEVYKAENDYCLIHECKEAIKLGTTCYCRTELMKCVHCGSAKPEDLAMVKLLMKSNL